MIKPIDTSESDIYSCNLPQTVDQAVDILMDLLDDELPTLAQMDDTALESLHISLGPYIRNQFGLWEGNKSLLDDCGERHPDDAYLVILSALVKRLKEG